MSISSNKSDGKYKLWQEASEAAPARYEYEGTLKSAQEPMAEAKKDHAMNSVPTELRAVRKNSVLSLNP